MDDLITVRLRLRPHVETDFDAFAVLHGDPALKANTHARPMDRRQARELFDGYMAAYARDGFGMMNLRLRHDDTFVGECGLWFREDAGGYTLRYTILEQHWGLGYSIEAVRVILADAFLKRGLDRIQAIAMHHNVRSVRVLEQAGFRQTESAFRGVPGFLRFELDKDVWSSLGGLPPPRGRW